MQRCKCGKLVQEGASGAVFVYNKERTLAKRVICSTCATNRRPRIRFSVYRKQKEEWLKNMAKGRSPTCPTELYEDA